MQLSQYRLAKDISVPTRRINEIVHGKRSITPHTALRLSRYFGMSERFWLNLQTRYDLEMEKDRLAGRLEEEVRDYEAAKYEIYFHYYFVAWLYIFYDKLRGKYECKNS
jgi:addiction module HigA family antidote